jgi:hypothetical protein
MFWTAHHALGVYEHGPYTIRRTTLDFELWYKPSKDDFRLLGRASTVKEAKADAEQHARSTA